MDKENNFIVPTKKILNSLQNHNDKEIVYCEEDKTMYKWENEKWNPINIENKGISMNLYDLNKSIISQLNPMTASEIASKMNIFDNLIINTGDTHYMLLCKDYNYYTIFEYDNTLSIPTFGTAVCDIISELGDVISIEETKDNDNKKAIEIWIKPIDSEEVYVFYLFPYSGGIVYYG